MPLLLNISQYIVLWFHKRFADLDPVTITTFPFRLGSSSRGLNVFEGATPIFRGGRRDEVNHGNDNLTVEALHAFLGHSQ